MMFCFRSSNRLPVRLLAFLFILLSLQLAAAQGEDPTNGETDPIKLFERGQDAHAKNDYQKAIDLYDAAIKLKPEFAEAEFQRAMALLATNRNAEAIEGFNRAVKLRPDWTMAYSKFGTYLGSYGNDAAKAEPILRRAIELDPKDHFALTVLAEIRARAGDFTEAVKLARSATSQPKANSATWRKRAYIEWVAGDRMAALASLDQALIVSPSDLGARYDRARLRLVAGNREAAVADLQELEKAGHGSNFAGALELAQLYARADRRQDALRILDALQPTDGNRPEVVALRAEISDTGGSTSEERDALEQLLSRDPRNAALLARLGSSYRRVNPEKSAAYYRSALEIEPKNIKYAIGYAAALNQLRRFADAEAVLRKVIQSSPDEYTAHANLALALYELKRFAEAIPEYEWLAKARPEIAATYFFIATAHDNLGEYQQALDAYQQFLSHADPTYNKLEIEKVNLRLPILRAQIQRGQGVKRKNP